MPNSSQGPRGSLPVSQPTLQVEGHPPGLLSVSMRVRLNPTATGCRSCRLGFGAVLLLSTLLTWLCPAVLSQQLHQRMTPSELRRFFHLENPNDVPKYEVVRIRSISKRSANADDTRQVHLSAFGRKLHLNLRKNNEFENRLKTMKVMTAESTSSGALKYREVPTSQEEKKDLGTAYHDEEQLAAVLLRHDDNGGVQMEGTIGNDLVIQPVPSHLMEERDTDFVDDEMFLDEEVDGEQNITRVTPSVIAKSSQTPAKSLDRVRGSHIVYKRKQAEEDAFSDYLFLEPGESSNSSKPIHRIRKRQAPDSVWPEVLLVVDYDSYLLHGQNNRDIKRYFVSFWNGVDLRYKLLSYPAVKVTLAGMIVAKDRDATPYLERNRLRSPNDDAVDAAGALTDMGKYLFREDRLPTYDLAVVITKLDMCRRRFEGGRCNRGTAGFAYVGGACVVNKRLEKVNSVAIIEDSGGFSGIIVAAHEVGHLLGCVHDGSPPPSYLGGPGATRCPWEDGFIMSDLRHTERGFRWSSCSVEQFKHFLNGETASCLYNYPHENEILPRVLPGTLMSLDEQCKRDRGTTACFKDARVCAQLFCFDSGSGYCVSYRPAAEGSLCGDGQVCKNGRCVTEIENIIPDYTHVTHSVVNRPQTRSSRDRILPKSDSPPATSHAPRRSYQRRPSPYSVRTTRSTIDYSQESPPTKRPASACRDVIQQLPGDLTCDEFLKRYGYRYCRHQYMKENCCASHKLLCSKS